jgi:hypothetical protein
MPQMLHFGTTGNAHTGNYAFPPQQPVLRNRRKVIENMHRKLSPLSN